MKTAIFLLGGVLVASILFMSEAASLYRYDDTQQYDSAYEDLQDLLLNKTNCTGGIDCYYYPWPFPVCCAFVFQMFYLHNCKTACLGNLKFGAILDTN